MTALINHHKLTDDREWQYFAFSNSSGEITKLDVPTEIMRTAISYNLLSRFAHAYKGTDWRVLDGLEYDLSTGEKVAPASEVPQSERFEVAKSGEVANVLLDSLIEWIADQPDQVLLQFGDTLVEGGADLLRMIMAAADDRVRDSVNS